MATKAQGNRESRNRMPAYRLVAVVIGLLMIVACASTPPPTAALQAAELAIANAEREAGANPISSDLGEARVKLANARTAVRDKKMELALHLADESRVTAELSSAKSEAAKAKAVNEDMRKSLDEMKQEMQRNNSSNTMGNNPGERL